MSFFLIFENLISYAIEIYAITAPITKKIAAINTPDFNATYGSESTPDPTAVANNASILPLNEPGLSLPNHLLKQGFFLDSSVQ